MCRVVLLLIVFCGTAEACRAQEKPASAADKFLAHCTQTLKFGETNDFYRPMKSDAVVALGFLGDERAVPILLEHLENERDQNLKFQIIRALGWIKSPKAVPALEKAMKQKEPTIRDAAMFGLEDITGKDYGSKKRLREHLADALGGDIDVGLGAISRKGSPRLEVGKTYRFVFSRGGLESVTAELLEAPRDGWIKLRVNGSEASDSWMNLSGVHMVIPAATAPKK